MSVTDQPVTKPDSTDRPILRQALREIVDSGFVGATLRVHDEHGDWSGSAGRAGLDAGTEPSVDSRFRIGSNTKTFVATLALLLVADGKLELDAPVAGHLPDLALDRRITLRMLLQHTSGIFNFTGEYDPDGTVVPGIRWQGRAWVEGRFTTYEPQELVRLALSKPARFEPGTDWSYSNTNYAIVRLLIEKTACRSLPQELERRVLGPLGLAGTVVPTTQAEIAEPYLRAYYRYEDGGQETTVDVSRQNPSWISSGGDMISTTGDLQTFLAALTGGRVLPAPLLTEMLTPRPTPVPGMGYGLGVFVQELADGGTLITHNGGIAGHAGLMYAAPDGSRTLTAGMNGVYDADLTLGAAYQQATQRLVGAVFGAQG